MLIRSAKDNTILILKDGKEILEKKSEFLANLGVDGIIRIQESEYEEIDIAKKYLAHFNLECTNHEVGKKYVLAKIVRPGYYDAFSGVQVLPLLSFEHAYTGVCVDVKNYLKYEDVGPEYFPYSLSGIQTIRELKSRIHTRYSVSMPNLSKKEIERNGVGYTLLKFE